MKTTLENNKLIAEFMGYGAQLHLVEHPETGEYVDPEFHISWDWLMPVVEKIESLYEDGIDVTQYSDGILIENWREQKEIIRLTRAEQSYTRIEFTYYAVVEFIKWYNL